LAILKIARMGHPQLMRVADPIEDPTVPDIQRLAADMIDTMRDAPGIGLAAPQVHIPKRMVIYYVPEGRDEEEKGHPLTTLINPVITVLDPELEAGAEGCLSLPGMVGMVERPQHISVKALDLQGNTLEYEAKGYHARVIQHECDHLDGVIYPMRMTDLSTLGYVEEMTSHND